MALTVFAAPAASPVIPLVAVDHRAYPSSEHRHPKLRKPDRVMHEYRVLVDGNLRTKTASRALAFRLGGWLRDEYLEAARDAAAAQVAA